MGHAQAGVRQLYVWARELTITMHKWRAWIGQDNSHAAIIHRLTRQGLTKQTGGA